MSDRPLLNLGPVKILAAAPGESGVQVRWPWFARYLRTAADRLDPRSYWTLVATYGDRNDTYVNCVRVENESWLP